MFKFAGTRSASCCQARVQLFSSEHSPNDPHTSHPHSSFAPRRSHLAALALGQRKQLAPWRWCGRNCTHVATHHPQAAPPREREDLQLFKMKTRSLQRCHGMIAGLWINRGCSAWAVPFIEFNIHQDPQYDFEIHRRLPEATQTAAGGGGGGAASVVSAVCWHWWWWWCCRRESGGLAAGGAALSVRMWAAG